MPRKQPEGEQVVGLAAAHGLGQLEDALRRSCPPGKQSAPPPPATRTPSSAATASGRRRSPRPGSVPDRSARGVGTSQKAKRVNCAAGKSSGTFSRSAMAGSPKEGQNPKHTPAHVAAHGGSIRQPASSRSVASQPAHWMDARVMGDTCRSSPCFSLSNDWLCEPDPRRAYAIWGGVESIIGVRFTKDLAGGE
jgi:hypothetical protein